jgi:8-oxo-dGTP pyrophosphatase MutT (NUDIX family)
MSAYSAPVPAVADRYVLSVRCLARVGDAVIACENPDGVHIWPGGRREPGETVAETAVREVREETGWVIDRASVQPMGLLHYHHLTPVAADHPYPYPDFCQLVVAASAAAHVGEPDKWSDLDGWEQRTRLVPISDIAAMPLTAAERFFAGRLTEQASPSAGGAG